MAARLAVGLGKRPRPGGMIAAAIYVLAVWLAGPLADRPGIAAAPFVTEVLPWAPPAILLLVAYLGARINQSRIVFAVAAFLLAYGVLAHPYYMLAEALALTGLALPAALAIIVAVPEGRVLGPRGLVRLLLALTPFPALAALLAFAPDAASWLVAWRIPGFPATGAVPHAAFVCAVPLVAAAIALREDRLAPFLPALLVATAALLGAVGADLAPAGAAPVRVVLRYAALSLVLLHAVIHLFWRRSYEDELTGLPNRRALEEALFDVPAPYAVAMIDLDRFKRFNDRYGHAVGDQTLRYAATHLRRELGPRVYRYGGEEFCAIFADTLAGEAAAFTERARRRLVAHPFRRRGRRWWPARLLVTARDPRPSLLRFTISAGVASPRRPGDTPERVRAAADAALYRAKRAGRNRVVIAGRPRP